MQRQYERVPATPAEVENYRREHASIHYIVRPRVHRVRCVSCGLRLWGSGFGIASHNRACKG